MHSSVTITQNEKLFDELELKSRLCRLDGLKRRLGKFAEDFVFLAFSCQELIFVHTFHIALDRITMYHKYLLTNLV